jgi:4Fe-4S ferredoxin
MTNAMELYQMLPKTNCKKCGKTSCMAFAVALMARELTPEDCPPLKEEPKYKENYEKISGLFNHQKVRPKQALLCMKTSVLGVEIVWLPALLM